MTQTVTKKIPTLRFPGFIDAWEEKKLGSIADYKNGGSFEDRVVSNGKYNLITLNSIDIDGRLKTKHKKVLSADWYLEKNDLIMVLSDVAHGNFLGLVDIIPADDKYVLNQRMGLLRKTDKDVDLTFIRTYINKNQRYFKLHGQGSSQQNLSKGDILKFKIILPLLPEQRKIASFLSSVDEWIENLREQKKQLEKYKKGMIQKIFSQEIRFKDKDGKDFPEWEEKKLEDVVDFSTASYFDVDKNCDSGYYLIDMGAISIEGKLLVKKRTRNKEDLLEKGDLIMPNRDIGHGEIIGKVALIESNEMYVLGSNMYRLLPKKDFSEFLFYSINSQQANREMRRRSNGTSQLQLIRKDVGTVKISIPNLLEQQKIAKFLSFIDQHIDAKEVQIKKVEEWKKGLLQQMFV